MLDIILHAQEQSHKPPIKHLHAVAVVGLAVGAKERYTFKINNRAAASAQRNSLEYV